MTRIDQQLIDAIRQHTRQHSGAIFRVLLFTFGIPWIVFIITWLIGDYARRYVGETFNDSFLNLTTAISTFLVVVAATYSTWRWAERRFGGGALVRRLLQTTRAVLEVEKAIEATRTQPSETQDQETERLARQAWETYTRGMRESGFPVQGMNTD